MRIVALGLVAVVSLIAQGRAESLKSIQRAEAWEAWGKSAMTVYDFLGQAKSLMGKAVSVHGDAECISEMLCYLRDPDNPTIQVVIESSALRHTELQKLLACHANSEKCETTITGRVAKNAFGELRLAGKGK